MARGPFNVFLANPAPAAERIGFSFITPRALPVLAAVTPRNGSVANLKAIDQAIEEFSWDDVRNGDLVGISIHTFNATTATRWRASAGPRSSSAARTRRSSPARRCGMATRWSRATARWSGRT